MGSTTPGHVQAQLDAYWTDRADGYAEFQRARAATPPIQQEWQRVWSSALPEPPASVLDVGTGTGQVAWLLAGLGYDVTGIDTSEGMLEEARRSSIAGVATPPDFRAGDAVVPPVGEGSLDAITARYVLWTLRDAEDALANWRRLLRPGGALAVVDSTWFADGLDHGPQTDGPDGDVFRRHYDEQVLAALPLAQARTIDDTVDLIRRSGYLEVEVRPLDRMLELDREHGVAPGHQAQLQYLIVGHAPR